MKRIYTILTAVLLTATVWAQSPEKMSYQAVVRDASNQLVTSIQVGIEINIYQGSTTGTLVYTETQTPTTNVNGLLSIEIGGQTGFDQIDWANGPYFIETNIDVAGGTNYTITGVSQLLTVPYALHAKTAESITGGITETDPVYNSSIASGITATNTSYWNNKLDAEIDGSVTNEIQNLSSVLAQGNDAGAKQIKNLTDPTDDQDAATKAYVEKMKSEIYTQIAGGKVTDYDGNTYNTVKIGNQIWMTENLKVTHYPNGDAIPLVTDNTAWDNLADDNTSDAYSYYNNNAGSEANTYGALYTYAAAIGDNWAKDNTANQGVCPDGWHLPSDAEWTELTDYLGGTSVAGGKMKEIGTTHWQSPNTGADNSSGFSALPGGDRYDYNGAFRSVGDGGYWWSSTEGGSNYAYSRSLYYYNANVNRYNDTKSFGFSVRCVRD